MKEIKRKMRIAIRNIRFKGGLDKRKQKEFNRILSLAIRWESLTPSEKNEVYRYNNA